MDALDIPTRTRILPITPERETTMTLIKRTACRNLETHAGTARSQDSYAPRSAEKRLLDAIFDDSFGGGRMAPFP